jgi:hypothetical protein
MKHVIYGDKATNVTPKLLNNITIEVGALVDYCDGRKLPIPAAYSVMMSAMLTMAQWKPEAIEILRANIKEMDHALDELQRGVI